MGVEVEGGIRAPDDAEALVALPLLKAKVGVVATIFKRLDDEECLIDADGTTNASEAAAAATRAMAVEGSFMIYYGFALWEELLLLMMMMMMKVKNYERTV